MNVNRSESDMWEDANEVWTRRDEFETTEEWLNRLAGYHPTPYELEQEYQNER